MPYTFSDRAGPIPCHACGENVPTEPKRTGWHVAFHLCEEAS